MYFLSVNADAWCEHILNYVHYYYLQEYMQRENELEDELEKYQKLEKQWNEKREKMEAKIDSLTAKVQELEALIASNETKVCVFEIEPLSKSHQNNLFFDFFCYHLGI